MLKDTDQITIEPLRAVNVCVSNTDSSKIVLHFETEGRTNYFFATTRTGLANLADRFAINAATPRAGTKQ